MKVEQLTAFHIRIPLKKAIKHASHTRTETDNVLICCVLKDGSVGFGEGVPREYVTGESIDSVMDLLEQSQVQSQLGHPQSFDEALEMIEKVSLKPIPGDDRKCQGNAARCALELALLDAYGHCFGEPLTSVTQKLAPELYEFVPWVRYSGAITSAKGFKARLAAWKMRIFRFKQIKLKVGIEGYDDVKRLKSIRRRVGKKMDIRIDANEAWSPSETAQRIQELEPFGITSVEQPVKHEEVESLASIREQVQTPIMLDESLCSMVDAERSLEKKTCDLFNIRLSKCGGFIPSLRLAQFAQQNNLGYQLGCQVGETAVLSAAGRHFATSVQGIRYLEGSYDRHRAKESLATEDITFKWGGWGKALIASGLGVAVGADALERVQDRRVDLIA